jgi:hypothetical protein
MINYYSYWGTYTDHNMQQHSNNNLSRTRREGEVSNIFIFVRLRYYVLEYKLKDSIWNILISLQTSVEIVSTMPVTEGTQFGLPPATGLYDPRYESDACGVGYVVSIDGVRSHKVKYKYYTNLF